MSCIGTFRACRFPDCSAVQGVKPRGTTLTPVMALQFITEGAIGPKERKLIRSHVMKGKNAGRPRPPRRTLRDVCTSSQDARHTTPPGYDHSKANELEALYSKQTLRLNRILWNDLTLASFPLYASPESGRFVYQCELKPDLLHVSIPQMWLLTVYRGLVYF